MERGGEAVGDEEGTMGEGENGGQGEGVGRRRDQKVRRTPTKPYITVEGWMGDRENGPGRRGSYVNLFVQGISPGSPSGARQIIPGGRKSYGVESISRDRKHSYQVFMSNLRSRFGSNQ